MREGGGLAEELTVIIERFTRFFTHSVLERPGSRCAIPDRPLCRNLIDQLEVARIELVHIDAGHYRTLRVEKMKVIDARALSIYPLPVRSKIGGNGFLLDLCTQPFLAAICFRNVVMVETKQCGADGQTHDQHRSGQAIEADAACFKRSHLVMFREYAETD